MSDSLPPLEPLSNDDTSPSLRSSTAHQTPSPAPRSNNALWGCGGMIGCGILLVLLGVGASFVGLQSVLDNVTGLFNLPSINIQFGEPAEIDIPEEIYIPPVERVQALSQLTTTRYNYADVNSGQRAMPGWLATLYGDSMVLVVVGTIEAGIDVSQITQEDILYDEVNKVMTITLPAPVIQSCYLDESQSYVVRRNTAIFAEPMDNLETVLRHDALLYYRDTAIEEGILSDAEDDATVALQELITILVNDETVTINIAFDDPLADYEYPSSCQ